MIKLASSISSKLLIEMTACFLCISLAGLSGCGGSAELHSLSGKVTFQGEPVPFGSLTFIPDEAAGNLGPKVRLDFENGQYQTPEGSGVTGGQYLAEVDGFEYDQSIDDNEPEAIRLFPIQQLKVEFPSTGGTFDFVLPVKNKSPE